MSSAARTYSAMISDMADVLEKNGVEASSQQAIDILNDIVPSVLRGCKEHMVRAIGPMPVNDYRLEERYVAFDIWKAQLDCVEHIANWRPHLVLPTYEQRALF